MVEGVACLSYIVGHPDAGMRPRPHAPKVSVILVGTYVTLLNNSNSFSSYQSIPFVSFVVQFV